MTRRTLRLAPLALAALTALAGCQEYNFSPVNQCLIQPGSERVTLSDISTADILFVVDDSGSMGGEQQSLQSSFSAFVANLRSTNLVRVTNGLEPIDFHIAVTTTSVFLNQPVAGGATCQSSCGGAAGQVCCNTGSRPLLATKACRVDADCTGAGGPWTCQDLKQQFAPEKACVNAGGAALEEPVACPVLGQPCGELQRRYAYRHGPRSCVQSPVASTTSPDCRDATYTCKSGCSGAPAGGTFCCDAANQVDLLQCNPGTSAGEYSVYPRGDFVKASTSDSGAPPRVIHFDKNLFCNRTADGSACACTGAGAPATCDPPNINDTEITRRSNWFKANVAVGTCGSSQEQGLEGARRALKKALRLDGLAQPADVLPTEWPHPKSKLVVVWVGDEDDCSSPEDASQGVIFSPTVDTCEDDGNLPVAERKRFALDDFSSFFASLDRPLATGFIVSATGTPPTGSNVNDCVDASCQPNLCVDLSCTSGPGLCGGQARGYRYLELASTFTTKGSDMVAGSICAKATAATPPDFSSILDRVAEVVKQPNGLSLPTQPAAAGLSILRIVGTDGKTRKTCSAPAPAGTSGAALNDYDWWFIDPADKTDPTGLKPTGASKAIHINRTVLRCTANPGETYSADYLGLVPVGGCDPAELDLATGQPKACVDALGVRKTPWVCMKETGAARGSCLCGG
jgi:hypothetical protein